MLTEPIEQLARLLTQEKRADEKIRETRALLACVKKRISESLAQRYIEGESNIPVEEDLMKTEQSYERLLQALVDMKGAFEQQMRALDEQIVQANVEHLRQTFDQKKSVLADCVLGIDQKIVECLAYVEEYKRAYADLMALNEKLHQLGSDSLAPPDPLPTNDLGGVIAQRIEYLRSQGRL